MDKPRIDPQSIDESVVSDWHNDYAALLLEISNDLRSQPSAEARRDLLPARRTLKDRKPGRGGVRP